MSIWIFITLIGWSLIETPYWGKLTILELQALINLAAAAAWREALERVEMFFADNTTPLSAGCSSGRVARGCWSAAGRRTDWKTTCPTLPHVRARLALACVVAP